MVGKSLLCSNQSNHFNANISQALETHNADLISMFTPELYSRNFSETRTHEVVPQNLAKSIELKIRKDYIYFTKCSVREQIMQV